MPLLANSVKAFCLNYGGPVVETAQLKGLFADTDRATPVRNSHMTQVKVGLNYKFASGFLFATRRQGPLGVQRRR